MNRSRRLFCKTTLISTALAAMPMPVWAADRPPLKIPPLIESRRGKPVLLGMESTQVQLSDNKLVEVWGFNGQYLGPTVKVKKGDFVKLSYHNKLPQPVSMNIQGLQLASELMGGIARHFKSGESWSPILPITQSAATCYYHACTLAHSAYQNYRGLVGLWLIEDDDSRKAQLPQKYGVDDIPLILQDLQLNGEGTQLFHQNDPHFFGNRLFVNGQEAPYLNVQRGWVRLRILNASISRPFELRFDDNREMLIIARDQGFLPQSQSVKSVFIGMGERVELLVDLNEGENVTLIAGEQRGFMDKVRLFFNADNQLLDNTVLELRPQGLMSAFNNKPSSQFINNVQHATTIAQERTFELDAINAMINQKRFDPRRIDVNAKLGSTERWTITASEPTGFRIQGAKFIVESVNEQMTEDRELVWKDTVWINGKVRLLVTFENLSSNMQPFIFGTSDLMLADKGAIGLIVVQ